ncbi:MAG: hypothetical protein JNJ89_13035 [Rubrivivax sp.]|nr:hypothetical protein [Rubrivivax sp.]
MTPSRIGALAFALLQWLLVITWALVPAQRAEAAKLGQGCSVFYPCEDGLSCHPFVQKCFHVPRRESEPCMAGHGCGPGLNCEAGSQVCRAPGKSGEACHVTRPCGAGLSCQPGVHRCYAVPRAENEPCSAGFGCGPGLTCEAGSQVCRATGKVGDACHLTRPCGSGLSCQPGVQRCYHSPRAENEPCVAGYGCAAGLSCMAGKQVCEKLAAKQCIHNMAGYSAKVEWWRPQDLSYTGADGKYTLNAGTGKKAAKVDSSITLGFSSCNDTAETRTAVVRIEGGNYVNSGIGYAAGALVAAAGGAGSVLICGATAGAGCAGAVAGTAAAVGGVISMAQSNLPDVPQIAFIGTPTTTQEIRLTGTVWAPAHENGTLRGGAAAHAGSPADLARACREAVQGKVAWSRGGSTQWVDSNLNALCEGAKTPSAIAACVTEGITAHNDWQRAVRECKGR